MRDNQKLIPKAKIENNWITYNCDIRTWTQKMEFREASFQSGPNVVFSFMSATLRRPSLRYAQFYNWALSDERWLERFSSRVAQRVESWFFFFVCVDSGLRLTCTECYHRKTILPCLTGNSDSEHCMADWRRAGCTWVLALLYTDI